MPRIQVVIQHDSQVEVLPGGAINIEPGGELQFDNTAITATAAELNTLDGVTASASELNILDGVTASTAELNILDGVTASAAELNILDGVTASASELNILDGVTASASELNILDGVTASTAQINAIAGLVDAEGDLKLTDTQWEDLRFPAIGINPPGAASDPTRDTSDGRLSFSATVQNIIAIQVQMPHGWKQGTAIRPHVHWSPTTTGSGDVVWQLEYKIANVNEAFPGSYSTLTATDAASGTTDQHQITGLGSITMTGKTFSCMMLMLLSRMGAAGGDTYAAPVKLLEFDIHYEVERFGTDSEFTED